jgi:hypothetical protein
MAMSAIAHSSIRVTVIRSDPQPDIGRWADVPAFWGGALIYRPVTGGDCSTGFGLHSTTSPTTYYLLTAGHCVPHHEPGAKSLADPSVHWAGQ